MSQSVDERICIITPSYVSSAPRVVKEADALRGAGFDVRVVFSQGNLQQVRLHDSQLLGSVEWSANTIGWDPAIKGESWTYQKTRYRQHAARYLSRIKPWGKLPEYAEGRLYGELSKLAVAERSGLYIGHCPTGLAVASYAARFWKSKLGYDIEDLHTSELSEVEQQPGQVEGIRIIESRYLRDCDHVSAVSDGVADQIADRYKVKRPIVIHNTFPFSERKTIDGQMKDRTDLSTPSLYWYSQTIGEGRGIEDAIRATGLLRGRVQLHLRGTVSGNIETRFRKLAHENGVSDSVHFHPQVPPAELISRTVEHDIGLALEQPICENRLLTVTNKLFFYLTAGLAVAATDTTGQRSVLKTCPEAGFVYPPGDYQVLASEIKKLVDNPDQLKARKEAALIAARDIWNWEKESARLVEAVTNALAK